MTLAGRTFVYRYKSGLVVEGRFLEGDKVAWKALSGPAAGTSGVEQASIALLRANLFLVCWVEQSGVTVTQVVDLESQSVRSFITFDTPSGRQGLLDEGDLEASHLACD